MYQTKFLYVAMGQ